MKRIVYIALVTLALFLFASCEKKPANNDIITYYNAAEKMIESGDYDSAQKLIDEAVSIYGESELLKSLILQMEQSTDLQTEAITIESITEAFAEPETTAEPVATTCTETSKPEPEPSVTTTKKETATSRTVLTTTSTTKPTVTGFTTPSTTKRTTSIQTTLQTTRTQPTTTTVSSTTQKSSQERALDLAKAYIEQTANSRSQIIDQIKKKGFSESDAIYAVDRCGANWNNQAIKAAKKCASGNIGYQSGYSYEGMKTTLERYGFSESEATYAVNNAGIDWNEQAVKKANGHINTAKHSTSYSGGFSYDSLVRQLEYSKFTHEQAVYGASNCGADWYEQAVLSAKAELHSKPDITDEELYKLLTGETFSLYGGFKPDEAQYAVSHCR